MISNKVLWPMDQYDRIHELIAELGYEPPEHCEPIGEALDKIIRCLEGVKERVEELY